MSPEQQRQERQTVSTTTILALSCLVILAVTAIVCATVITIAAPGHATEMTALLTFVAGIVGAVLPIWLKLGQLHSEVLENRHTTEEIYNGSGCAGFRQSPSGIFRPTEPQ